MPHIHYNIETDLDEIIRRFARVHHEEKGTGQYLRTPWKEEFRAGVKIHKKSREFSILDAFYSFNKVWFQSEKYRLTWDGKCEKYSVLFSLTQAQREYSGSNGAKIKTQKNPLSFKQNPKNRWTKSYPPKNPMANFRAIIKISRKHKMIRTRKIETLVLNTRKNPYL